MTWTSGRGLTPWVLIIALYYVLEVLTMACVRILAALGSFLVLSNSQLLASQRVHLDVNRYCRRVFAQGSVWNGRQYTRDGWHRYNSARNLHECGFEYRKLESRPIGLNLWGASAGRVQSTTGTSKEVRYEEAFLQKACREQNNNPNSYPIQNREIVWCVLP